MEKKSPSRIKYEQNNPVVSFRISKELYDSLQKAKEKQGMSYTDILRVGLGLITPTIRSEEKIKLQAYDKGWEQGNEMALEAFAITYPCKKCKKEMIVDTEEEKKAIREFLFAQGWHHGDCNNPD
jgi:hypothetical protein